MKTAETMPLLGGHPVLDFVNTVDSRIGRIGPDYLQSYDDLVAFARRTAVIDAATAEALMVAANEDAAEAADALMRARDLREAIYRICHSESIGSVPASDDVIHLQQVVHGAISRQALDAGPHGLAWVFPSRADLGGVSDRIAIAAMGLLVDGRPSRRRIKECPGRNCGWLFLDTSRGGKRRWCSDKTCGTGARVRKFRAG